MDRRRFLATTTSAILVGAVGYLGWRRRASVEPSARVPEGMVVEARYWSGDILKDGIMSLIGPGADERNHDFPDGHYWKIITDQQTAIELEREDITEAFIQETDFKESYVLIFQVTMPSARWLELEAIERTEVGHIVEVMIGYPERLYGDDSIPHSLGVRIADEMQDVPKEVIVKIAGHRFTVSNNPTEQ